MQLRTLGTLALEGSDFQRPKPLLLLCYVALEGRQERRHLAELFWPGAANSLASLSAALTQLRQGAPGSFGADRVRIWTEVAADSKELLALLERNDFEKAVELYQGRFLNGVYLADWSPELEEWVYHTREFLGSQMRKALISLAEVDASRGQFERAARQAEQAYLLSGAPEPEPEELDRLCTLMLAGNSLLTAEIRKEAEYFDLILTATAEEAKGRLYKVPNTANVIIPYNLPTSDTSFVGRDFELTETINLLMKSDCRLLTLTGPGGVGKTRLALQVASEFAKQAQFKNGIFFVALDSLTVTSHIPSSIASALSLEWQGQDEPLSYIIHYLRDKCLLLVLDNFEHLIEGAPIVSDLLQRCPKLKLLVTSREPLMLMEESLYAVDGLSVPNEETASLGEIKYFDSIQLFFQRAKRSNNNFEPTPNDLSSIITICHLVSGSPLGIELAATWTRVLTCQDIAYEIRRNLDFLTSTMRNTTDRHQSLRATFEHSWALLNNREKELLCSLSAFAGGFRRTIASEIIGATIPQLASLVNKSLLRLTPTGRYEMHPLIQQFSREKLALNPELESQVLSAHSRVFLNYVAQLLSIFNSSEENRGLRWVEEDLDNIRAAWDWAVKHKHFQMLEAAARTLGAYFDAKGLWHLGNDLFHQACLKLNEGDPRINRVLGTLLAFRVKFTLWLGRGTEAENLATKAVVLLNPSGDSYGKLKSFLALGELKASFGHLSEAQNWIEQALLVAQNLKEPMVIAETLSILAWVKSYAGRSEEAAELLNQAGILLRPLSKHSLIVQYLRILGLSRFFQGRIEDAKSNYSEALEMAYEIGAERFVAQIVAEQAFVAFANANYKQALEMGHEALMLAEQTRDHLSLMLANAIVGRANVAVNRLDQAERYLCTAINLAWKSKSMTVLFGTSLVWLAELKRFKGEIGQAVMISAFIQDHVLAPSWGKYQAKHILDELSKDFSREEFQKYVDQSKYVTLEYIIAGLLEKSVQVDTDISGKSG